MEEEDVTIETEDGKGSARRRRQVEAFVLLAAVLGQRSAGQGEAVAGETGLLLLLWAAGWGAVGAIAVPVGGVAGRALGGWRGGLMGGVVAGIVVVGVATGVFVVNFG